MIILFGIIPDAVSDAYDEGVLDQDEEDSQEQEYYQDDEY